MDSNWVVDGFCFEVVADSACTSKWFPEAIFESFLIFCSWESFGVCCRLLGRAGRWRIGWSSSVALWDCCGWSFCRALFHGLSPFSADFIPLVPRGVVGPYVLVYSGGSFGSRWPCASRIPRPVFRSARCSYEGCFAIFGCFVLVDPQRIQTFRTSISTKFCYCTSDRFVLFCNWLIFLRRHGTL